MTFTRSTFTTNGPKVTCTDLKTDTLRAPDPPVTHADVFYPGTRLFESRYPLHPTSLIFDPGRLFFPLLSDVCDFVYDTGACANILEI